MTCDELAAIVREYTEQAVAAALAPVLEAKQALELRVKDLEARPVERGERGERGEPGQPGAGVVDVLINRAGELVLTFADGRTKNVGIVVGRDADPVEMKRIILEEVAKIPTPVNGVDGKDGRDGLDGKDGVAGLNGKDGRDGLDGKDGAAGLNGKDGRDGVDGMTLENAALDCTDEGWALTLAAGGQTKSFPLPWPFDLGPWVAGTRYKAGSSVSWDGSAWVAKADTLDQPGQSAVWRCVVRRGKQGPPGQPGKDGRDLRPGNTPDLYA